MNSSLFFLISFRGNESSVQYITSILPIAPFHPTKMSLPATHKKTKYNEAVFIESINEAYKANNRFNAGISLDLDNSIRIRFDCISEITTIILRTNMVKDIDDYSKSIDSFIESHNIVSAVLRSSADNHINSSLEPEIYKTYGVDTDNLKMIYSPTLHKDIVDIEQFSGHGHEFGGILFTSAFLMWYGANFFRFIPQDILQSFSDCWTNETLKNGTVKIQLYADIEDYQSELAIKRQWAFREFANIDKVAEDWHSEYYAIAATDHSSANMEILTGVFPHGGVRQVRMYLDKDGKNTAKKNAAKYVYKEYDSSGKVIAEGECDTESD